MKNERFVNAGGVPFVPVPGSSAFDVAMSFNVIRCGRLAATVLGGLQVSAQGDLANCCLLYTSRQCPHVLNRHVLCGRRPQLRLLCGCGYSGGHVVPQETGTGHEHRGNGLQPVSYTHLVVEGEQQEGLDELGLNGGGADGEEGLPGEDGSALRHSPQDVYKRQV